MIRVLTDVIFPPARTPAPQTPPPADPASSCMTAGASAAPDLGLILGIVCAVVLFTAALVTVLAVRKKRCA